MSTDAPTATAAAADPVGPADLVDLSLIHI